MDEFYVEKAVNELGEHVVHKDCCSALPPKAEMHYIGVRSTTAVPLKEAANYYSKSTPCPVCMS